jgi:hypothetical protein
MRDGLDGARALLPGVRLEHLETLGGSDRSVVRRVSAQPGTLIVKTFTDPGEGWVRESAALSVLPPAAPAPRLVAAGDAPPIVVMSDVGAGGSVAEALLGADPAVAADAVVSWATAIASLHRATAGVRGAFRAALETRAASRARAGEPPVPESAMPALLDDAARAIVRHCAELAIDIPAGALDQLRGLAVRLGGDGPAALTPADACPDNNVRSGDGLMLLDFEGAQWCHVAWDVAYLIVPWPSCWCCWRIPADVAERGIEAYVAASGLPYAGTPEFRRDVAAAAAGWALASVCWFLPRALTPEPPVADPDRPAPSRRAAILHRLDGVRRRAELSALAELAGRLRETLVGRWGEVPLDYAPAFAG